MKLESELACPADPYQSNAITGGAVFLTIVFCGFALYVIGGVAFFFFKSGEVAFPNQAFWTEFFACVSTGAIFIGTCGKATQVTVSSYDKI